MADTPDRTEVTLTIEEDDKETEFQLDSVEINEYDDDSIGSLFGPTEYTGTFTVTGNAFDEDDDTVLGSVMADDIEPAIDDRTVDYHQFEMDTEVVEKVHKRLVAEVESVEDSGHMVEEVVVGVPQYKALWLYANSHNDTPHETPTPSEYFGLDFITVPVPMIHVVQPNQRMLWKHG